MTEEQHWRPVGVRYWQRSGERAELGDFCVILVLDAREGIPHPPVIWKKSLQSIENKGKQQEKERQESSRDGKGLQGKEIEEIEERKEVRRAVVKGRSGERSQGMIRKISEVVKTLTEF
jgi:hypothetical protein